MSEVVNFADHAGFHGFVCEDCGVEIVAFCPSDREPVCSICRFVRDQGLPADVAATLRGPSDEDPAT